MPQGRRKPPQFGFFRSFLIVLASLWLAILFCIKTKQVLFLLIVWAIYLVGAMLLFPAHHVFWIALALLYVKTSAIIAWFMCRPEKREPPLSKNA